MGYNVLRKFKAPDGSGPFVVNGKFETDDERLAKSLIDAGLIESKKKPESKSEDKQEKKESSDKKKNPESK